MTFTEETTSYTIMFAWNPFAQLSPYQFSLKNSPWRISTEEHTSPVPSPSHRSTASLPRLSPLSEIMSEMCFGRSFFAGGELVMLNYKQF